MTKKVNIPTDSGADLQTVSQAVAVRIKAFRQQQKLSLDELSRRAGVSKGMLVEIEKCLANPSIAMLCKSPRRWAFPWRILSMWPVNPPST